MSDHRATIIWKGGDGDFLRGRYSREHSWTFDGGMVVQASSSPSVVPTPMSNPAYVDPEEAFVASLSSCHMLTFLYEASRKGFVVSSYDDAAVGAMAKNAEGVPWVSKVVLHPKIVYAGDKRPTPDQEHALHEAAHHGCFIAQSVRTEVTVEPVE
jgi:organic hydroperoxide reductase OsmC/OhrA